MEHHSHHQQYHPGSAMDAMNGTEAMMMMGEHSSTHEMEGEGAPLSGAFAGHLVAGTVYSCFGLLLLGLVFKRSLTESSSSSSAGRGGAGAGAGTYAERHIPERNTRLLFRIGMVLMILCPLGIVGEALSGWIVKDDWLFQAGHEALYFTFFFAGVVFHLESMGRLPPDSCRMGLAVALLASHLEWGGHAHMKSNEVDERLHVLLANTALANALAMAWSVREGSRSFAAYVVSIALLLLQGMWLYTAAFNLGIGNRYSDQGGAFLTMHNVTIIFCVELLSVAFAIVFGAAYVQKVHEDRSIDTVARKSVHDGRSVTACVVRDPEYEGLATDDPEK
jgi:Family of unknown function (DUF716)